MAAVSLHVPDDLKEKMREHDEINRSAVLRSQVEEKTKRLESRSIGHAIATSERLSNEIDEAAVADGNTAAVIRDWRDERYRADSVYCPR